MVQVLEDAKEQKDIQDLEEISQEFHRGGGIRNSKCVRGFCDHGNLILFVQLVTSREQFIDIHIIS